MDSSNGFVQSVVNGWFILIGFMRCDPIAYLNLLCLSEWLIYAFFTEWMGLLSAAFNGTVQHSTNGTVNGMVRGTALNGTAHWWFVTTPNTLNNTDKQGLLHLT